MRLQGDSFRKIATQLNAEGVPAPRTFYYMAEGRENPRNETPYWNDVTVKTILRNEVYIGHMVQNKTGTVSYKNHKQVDKPKNEWIKVENTHEPIISQEIRDAVQRMDNHPSRSRTGKSGMIALFGGLLRCMGYGSSFRYIRDYRKRKKVAEYKAYAYNHYMSGGKDACSSHYINQKAAKKRLDRSEKRVSELNKLFAWLYKDNVSGKISDEIFEMMWKNYEAEQKELKQIIPKLSQFIKDSERKNADTAQFIGIVCKYSDIPKLTPEIMHEFIEKIVVHAPDKSSGHRTQPIDICFRFNVLTATVTTDRVVYGKKRNAA